MEAQGEQIEKMNRNGGNRAGIKPLRVVEVQKSTVKLNLQKMRQMNYVLCK